MEVNHPGDLEGNQCHRLAREVLVRHIVMIGTNSALSVMDQHKTPQNMFRPLISSVPATNFRPIFSRNSSLTTSSNASSEQGVINVVFDVEGRELESTEQLIGWERAEDETHE
ncbi:hypothetical protein KSP39_PZI014409 [Platanthera zijinensis]|uniref:Uncharacterized protein n=1 Tax=Platanthera zijinensis TaxID=2320716 RepID=A0AAP0BB30_9ASPA